MKKAIVVVDMQNDFIDGALGTPEAQKMLPRLVDKLTAARAKGTALYSPWTRTERTTLRRRRDKDCPSSTAFAARRDGKSQRRSTPLCLVLRKH